MALQGLPGLQVFRVFQVRMECLVLQVLRVSRDLLAYKVFPDQ
jgi:hypothetical protein